MSTTEARGSDGSGGANVEGRHEARGRRHPRLRCRAFEAILPEARMEGGRHAAHRRAVHASGLAVLGPVRHGVTSAAPGSVQRTYLVVSDIDAALAELAAAGIEVGNVFHFGPDFTAPGCGSRASQLQLESRVQRSRRQQLAAPGDHDPAPGRVDAAETSYGSASDLANAMRRAAAAHGEHEKRIGEADANWPDWYAAYMVAEHAGTELPT